MNNITNIIHKLEAECHRKAEILYGWEDKAGKWLAKTTKITQQELLDSYDFDQSIITILERVNKTDKIVKEIGDVCQYLSVTAPPLVTDAEWRSMWYWSIDEFRKALVKRIREIIWKK